MERMDNSERPFVIWKPNDDGEIAASHTTTAILHNPAVGDVPIPVLCTRNKNEDLERVRAFLNGESTFMGFYSTLANTDTVMRIPLHETNKELTAAVRSNAPIDAAQENNTPLLEFDSIEVSIQMEK